MAEGAPTLPHSAAFRNGAEPIKPAIPSPISERIKGSKPLKPKPVAVEGGETQEFQLNPLLHQRFRFHKPGESVSECSVDPELSQDPRGCGKQVLDPGFTVALVFLG
jgi:hypothetical protein